MPTGEVDLKRCWWQKAKLSSALELGDTLLAGFLASTRAAEIVSDLFALERRPPPPIGGTAFARLVELRPTEDVRALFDCGSVERADAAMRLLDRILGELPARTAARRARAAAAGGEHFTLSQLCRS